MGMSPRLLRPRASNTFDPRTIPTCTAWFDATQNSTLTYNGSTISKWNNLVTNGTSYAQDTAAQQPSTTTLGGKTALLFGPGGNAAPRMDGPTLTELGDTTNNVLLVFFVIQFTGTTNGTNRFLSNVSSWRGGGSGFGCWPRYSNANVYWDAPESTARVFGDITATTINTAPTICRFRRAGAASSVHYNATQIAAISNASGALSSNLTEATRLAGGDSTTGDNSVACSEMIVYSSNLSAADVSAIEKALAKKYGISL